MRGLNINKKMHLVEIVKLMILKKNIAHDNSILMLTTVSTLLSTSTDKKQQRRKKSNNKQQNEPQRTYRF